MKGNTWSWLLLLVILIAVLGYLMGWFGSNSLIGGVKQESEYQAIFLSNGQVYFGQVDNEGGDVVRVKDIYYLQVQRQIQPKPGEEETQPEVKLIKLGNEIHGPMDQMRINRDQVVFVEDLKEDGKVVQAIKRFQRGEQPAESASVESGGTTE